MVDLSRLKQLEEELRLEVEGKLSNGPLLDILFTYFNTFDTYIVITDKKRNILFLNESIKDRISDLGHDPEKFIRAPCIGILTGECPLKDNCPVVKCMETKKVVVKKNTKSPMSDKIYDLVCMPLKYNGVSSVVEMWTEEEE